MSLLDELYDDYEKNQQEKLKQIHEHDIRQAQNLLRECHAKRYNIINVGFGSPLIKDEMGKYLDGETEFSINEMKRKKGLNYGSHEFSYQHDAVILEAINLKYINKINTLLVAPISSTKRRNSVLMEKKFYPFLERDSYILLESITNIGVEKIYLKDTKRRLAYQGSKHLFELREPLQKEIQKTLAKILI